MSPSGQASFPAAPAASPRGGVRATWTGLALVAAWLVVANLYALLSFNRFQLPTDTSLEWIGPHSVRPVAPDWDLVALHDRWDAYWYLDIAKNGYALRGEAQANVVFFPLYPLLVRFVGLVVGGDLVLAGWLVSSVCLALAAAAFARLVQEFHPEIDPVLPVVFLLAHPAAFFLNAVYSESLFLLLTFAMLLAARRGRFWTAGVFAALASATRVAGLFAGVLLAAEFIHAHGLRGLLTRRVFALGLAPLGILTFFLHHQIVFGDFFLFFEAQRKFGRDLAVTAADLAVKNSPGLVVRLLDYFFLASALAAGAWALVRLRTSYGVYMLVTLAVAIASGSLLGAARYTMVLFPIHLAGASLRSPALRFAWLFGSTLLQALYILCFVNHYWTS